MGQQKGAVIELVASHREQGRTVGEVLGSVGVARSSYYRWKKGQGIKTPVDRVCMRSRLRNESSSMRSRSKIRSIAIGASKGCCSNEESIYRRQ